MGGMGKQMDRETGIDRHQQRLPTRNLVVEGDKRYLSVQHFHSLKVKLNITMSFNPKSMLCVTGAEKHVILSENMFPVCVVLADHNFCPFVPAKRGEMFMLVVRRRMACWESWRGSLGMTLGITSG